MCHDDAMPGATGSARTICLDKTRAQVTRQGSGDTLKAGGTLGGGGRPGYKFSLVGMSLRVEFQAAIARNKHLCTLPGRCRRAGDDYATWP